AGERVRRHGRLRGSRFQKKDLQDKNHAFLFMEGKIHCHGSNGADVEKQLPFQQVEATLAEARWSGGKTFLDVQPRVTICLFLAERSCHAGKPSNFGGHFPQQCNLVGLAASAHFFCPFSESFSSSLRTLRRSTS